MIFEYKTYEPHLMVCEPEPWGREGYRIDCTCSWWHIGPSPAVLKEEHVLHTVRCKTLKILEGLDVD